MTTYVGIIEHPPQLCQTSNKLCAEPYRKLSNELASLSQKFGITVKIGPLITSDRSFMVIEADDYDNVRKFVTQSGLIQWNSVTTLPVINYETARAWVTLPRGRRPGSMAI
jgi:hypothetical protein